MSALTPSSPSKGLAAISLVAILGAGCTESPIPDCSGISAGRADAVVSLLTDARSPAFMQAVELVASNPKEVFGSEQLGLDAEPGIVLLQTYDAATGTVTDRGAFNLGGNGEDEVRRRGNAVAQTRCLKEAAASIADDLPGGDLLRALPGAASTAHARSDGAAIVVAFGLGRSTTDGVPLADVDLRTDAARQAALTELQQGGTVEPIATDRTGILFVAPDEGEPNSSTANGLRDFGDTLCTALGSSPCNETASLSLREKG